MRSIVAPISQQSRRASKRTSQRCTRSADNLVSNFSSALRCLIHPQGGSFIAAFGYGNC